MAPTAMKFFAKATYRFEIGPSCILVWSDILFLSNPNSRVFEVERYAHTAGYQIIFGFGPNFRYFIRGKPPMPPRVAYRRVLGLIAQG